MHPVPSSGDRYMLQRPRPSTPLHSNPVSMDFLVQTPDSIRGLGTARTGRRGRGTRANWAPGNASAREPHIPRPSSLRS